MIKSLKTSPTARIFLLNAICLGVGFWICWCLAVSAATASIRHQTQHAILASVPQLMPLLATIRLKDFGVSASPLDLSKRLNQALESSDRLCVLILDSKAHIVFASRDSHLRQNVVWQPDQTSIGYLDGIDTPAMRGLEPGRLIASDRSIPAVSCSLPDGEGRIVVHRTADASDEHSRAWLDALKFAIPLAFVWTWGLQGLAAYLILTRKDVNPGRQEHLPSEQQLKQNLDLVRTRDAVIFGLAKLSESRDPDTGQHLERICQYSSCLATALRGHPAFRGQISSQFVESIGISSALHDIGKVAIPDAVLLKPGRLSTEEFDYMRTHTTIGSDCLQRIEQRLGSSNFLAMAREIAAAHHERWDGNGYPRGLVGEAIPLAARIVAICDVYDALSVERCYKPAYSHDQCIEYIQNQAGKQFDPQIVEVFLQISNRFRDIRRAHPFYHPSGMENTHSSTIDTTRTREGLTVRNLSPTDLEESVLKLAIAIEEIAGEILKSDDTSAESELPDMLRSAAIFGQACPDRGGRNQDV